MKQRKDSAFGLLKMVRLPCRSAVSMVRRVRQRVRRENRSHRNRGQNTRPRARDTRASQEVADQTGGGSTQILPVMAPASVRPIAT